MEYRNIAQEIKEMLDMPAGQRESIIQRIRLEQNPLVQDFTQEYDAFLQGGLQKDHIR